MKLLVLAPQPFFQNRGTPIATLKMLHVLSADGHTIDLLTYHEGSAIDVDNCTHHRIPAAPFLKNIPPGFSLRKLCCDVVMMISVLRLCLRNRYHVVHAVEESVYMAMVVKLFTGVPYIYDMDSSLPRQLVDQVPLSKPFRGLFRWFERLAVRHSSGVVAVCQALEEVARSHSAEVPIVRIEDASLLTAAQGREIDRHSELPSLEGRIIMYVGNLQSYQGIDLLLDAFTHAYYRANDVRLVIIGGSDEQIRRYESIARKYNIIDRTHFLGPRPVDELGDCLSQADILVSPRTQGSNTPMKIFSYLESGKPVLATQLGMHTQVLNDEIALLVPPTPLDMARGMLTLLDQPGIRASLAEAAQDKIRAEFQADVLDHKLTEFYQELAQTLGCS